MDQDYTADDRREGEDIDGMPTLEALRNLWAARDDRYLDVILKPEAITAVRAYRISETLSLPKSQRDAGYVEARTWSPPR
jgi:hypothetical protein